MNIKQKEQKITNIDNHKELIPQNDNTARCNIIVMYHSQRLVIFIRNSKYGQITGSYSGFFL